MSLTINLLIAGAQKAGTSSFLRYLDQHPLICSHQQPEMNYFVNEEEFRAGFSVATARYFSCANKYGHTFVAKSVGILDSSTFIERVFNHNSKIQIVLSLRHPVDRAYSAYWFARRKGWEPKKSFAESIAASPERFDKTSLIKRECAYIERGIYIQQINRLLAYFPRKQLHIYLLEDIQHNTINICQSLYKACGLSVDFEPEVKQHHNTAAVARFDSLAQLMSSAKLLKKTFRRLLPATTADKVKYSLQKWNKKQVTLPKMSAETRENLIKFYRPYNDELSDFLGRDLSHWNQ